MFDDTAGYLKNPENDCEWWFIPTISIIYSDFIRGWFMILIPCYTHITSPHFGVQKEPTEPLVTRSARLWNLGTSFTTCCVISCGISRRTSATTSCGVSTMTSWRRTMGTSTSFSTAWVSTWNSWSLGFLGWFCGCFGWYFFYVYLFFSAFCLDFDVASFLW